MKITKRQLRKIVQEESKKLQNTLVYKDIDTVADAWSGGENLTDPKNWDKTLDLIEGKSLESVSTPYGSKSPPTGNGKAVPYGSGMSNAKLSADQKKVLGHSCATHVTMKSLKEQNTLGISPINEVGKVVWHSLSMSGKVGTYDVKFGKRIYENIPANKLIILKEKHRAHAPKLKENYQINEATREEAEAALENWPTDFLGRPKKHAVLAMAKGGLESGDYDLVMNYARKAGYEPAGPAAEPVRDIDEGDAQILLARWHPRKAAAARGEAKSALRQGLYSDVLRLAQKYGGVDPQVLRMSREDEFKEMILSRIGERQRNLIQGQVDQGRQSLAQAHRAVLKQQQYGEQLPDYVTNPAVIARYKNQ